MPMVHLGADRCGGALLPLLPRRCRFGDSIVLNGYRAALVLRVQTGVEIRQLDVYGRYCQLSSMIRSKPAMDSEGP